ncbi:hypothetical protein [Pseudoalteromonas luteoviolacea]|uniref:Uncharacterized protein n=1 Tax=Pseudoalteromonas luteoviolacea (strain 2ta16) TaxID=1353533 RepID=V4I468_PSEL2|nr:hypothetical protein [Pseudoalteromonas luteoviolacea]ESP95044.1 hypothetical protein PL2TA16_04600 [Pseudoalteromonas luteoviolacea 2ta16]KZN34154.1 hypothetical protein N483_25405 [Pseudoalteromonas luteoviolacea NCIMB 1944]
MSENKVDLVDTHSKSTVVDNGETVELNDVGKLVEGFLTPYIQGQQLVAAEATKRAEIQAKLIGRGLNYFFGIAFLILAIALFALFTGKDDLGEKIIFAVITFIGGLGLGKSLPKGS